MKSNPNLGIGQRVKFDRLAALPDKPDMKQCRYGTIVGVQFDEDDGVSYLVKEDYKRVRNTTGTEYLKLVRGPFTLHESEVQPDDIYVGKRVTANWPEKKYSRTVRIYWWYNNHVLVGPDDVVTDKPQQYQIVDRSQIEEANLVSLPPDQLLYAGIIYAFELMCEFGLVGSEKLEDVVEIVKACGAHGSRRAIKQYAANKGYGATHTLAEAVRTEQWESSKKLGESVTNVWFDEFANPVKRAAVGVPNTSAENVKRDVVKEFADSLGIPYESISAAQRMAVEESSEEPDPTLIKEGDAVAVSPDGKQHKLEKRAAMRDRIERVAKQIGVPANILAESDMVTAVTAGGVVVTQTTDQFIMDYETRHPLPPASEKSRALKGDTSPEETTVNCGGPLVSASVVKEKDAEIARLKAAIVAKDQRLRRQGEKINQADSRAKYWETKFDRLVKTLRNATK